MYKLEIIQGSKALDDGDFREEATIELNFRNMDTALLICSAILGEAKSGELVERKRWCPGDNYDYETYTAKTVTKVEIEYAEEDENGEDTLEEV